VTAGYLLVTAGGVRCGLPVDAVRTVTEIGPPYPAPASHAAVLGVVPRGGAFLPCVSLARFIGGAQGTDPVGLVVIAEVGGAEVALVVDDADDVVRGSKQSVPAGWDHSWVAGVVQEKGRSIPIVNLEIIGARLSPGAAQVP